MTVSDVEIRCKGLRRSMTCQPQASGPGFHMPLLVVSSGHDEAVARIITEKQSMCCAKSYSEGLLISCVLNEEIGQFICDKNIT